jgi:periplasmic divalent cation tolerance protein
MDPSRKLLLCLSTVASAEDADRIAVELVEKSLAACVQIDGPIRSHYRWQGQTHCDQEYRLMIKSAVTVGEQLKSKLLQLHPYDEPQIVMIEIDDASDGYRDWVLAQTAYGIA